MDAVGKSAFNPNVQQSDTFSRRDIRPFARTVLASFGEESKAFQKIAYEQMSIKDPMGTGAAQVAAATGHPDALARIEQLMEGTLSALPVDKAIARNIQADSRHEYGEARYVALGRLQGRLHVLCFTETADGIRVISFRKANGREVKRYAKVQTPD